MPMNMAAGRYLLKSRRPIKRRLDQERRTITIKTNLDFFINASP